MIDWGAGVVCEGSLGQIPVWAWKDGNVGSIHPNQEHVGELGKVGEQVS